MGEGVKGLAAMIGQQGEYRPGTGLTIPVLVMDARRAFGRVDLRITPVGGYGVLWVAGDRVKLRERAPVAAVA